MSAAAPGAAPVPQWPGSAAVTAPATVPVPAAPPTPAGRVPLATVPGDRAPGRALDRATAVVACVCVGFWTQLAVGLTLGLLVAVLLTPVWLPVWWRYRTGRLLLGLAVAAVLCGAYLTLAGAGTRAPDPYGARLTASGVAVVVTSAGVLVWAHRVLAPRTVVVLYGAGMLASALPRAAGSTDPWKYELSVPVTVLVLGACLTVSSVLVQVVAVLALAAVSAANDARSGASLLVVTAAVLVWQRAAGALAPRSTVTRTVVQLALLGVIAAFSIQAMLVEGVFGESARARTQAQIDTSGFVLAGARPEMGATAALLGAQPWGYGSGLLPDHGDVLTAKAGMAQLRYDPDNGYVERYLFGSGFEVHSVLGDLWIRLGPPGAVLAVTVTGLAAAGLVRALARRQASALRVLVTSLVAWDLLFSPFFSTSIAVMVLAVALAVTDSRTVGRAPP
ncbi:hypothetical protein J1G42_15390 [Cellulomonas sp. zg-ZUI222]|uniref:hypothetical protein n=1 Tax=Cellulomonas wangleii TaxID=2816956 RepID=UPI001A952F23|nr:hypothetical protein [Cellulomonas wangleii]MBO0922206.1 hypothetical protein [Cellulomonas wangleii]